MDADKQVKLAQIHFQLGRDALSKKNMLPKAFDELMQANTLLPNQPHVLDALAYAWVLRGDLARAESYYKKALQHGSSASIYNNYASLLNRLKRFTEAEDKARKALDDPRYPNQDLAFLNLGNALLGQHKYVPAALAFQQAKMFNTSNSLADLRLASTYLQQHKLHEARVLFDMVLHQQPDSRMAAEGLLSVLHEQQDRNYAYRILQQFSQHTSSPMDKAWALNALDQL